MTAELRYRLILLVSLVILGVGLAVIGTAVGATAPFIPGSDTSFVVSEDRIVFEHGDQQAPVIDNMSSVDNIKIERQDSGTYQINTETDDPLSDGERHLAKTIARNNGTIQQALGDMERYNITAEPIRKLTADSAQTTSVTGLNNTSMGGETVEKTFTVSEDSNETDTVSIDRDPEYVEGEAIVRIRDDDTGETDYSVTVDLQNKTVTDLSPSLREGR